MHKLYLLFVGLLLVSCQDKGVKFEVAVSGVQEGTPVFISQLQQGMLTPKDTAVVENGKAEFNLPQVDFQSFNALAVQGMRGRVYFINENKPLQATIDVKFPFNSKITGGPANEVLSEYMNHLAKSNQAIAAIERQYSEEELKDSSVQKLVHAAQSKILDDNVTYRKEVIKDHPDMLSSIFIFYDLLDTQAVGYDELKALYSSLSPQVQGSFIGQQVGKEFARLDAISVGGTAPGFSGKTPNGDALSLADVLKEKGEYTLVEFWASWCPDCQREMPHLVKVYQKYHDKGFKILGVSIDKTQDEWVKGIKDMQLTWHHISSLSGWEDPVARMYQVESIPSNFLLDKNGKIIASNLKAEDLDKKLEELFSKK